MRRAKISVKLIPIISKSGYNQTLHPSVPIIVTRRPDVGSAMPFWCCRVFILSIFKNGKGCEHFFVIDFKEKIDINNNRLKNLKTCHIIG